jgi:histidinol dehydrogenase
MALRARGRVADLSDDQSAVLLDRSTTPDPEASATVVSILADVHARGDISLVEMAERFDGIALETLEVPREAWAEALTELDPAVRTALERAARNIESFHSAQLPTDVRVETEPGVVVHRRWTPLERVGVYAPGGTAAYPSSVLMGVVPARAAGVAEVVVCSPAGPGGTPPSAVMAACALARADRLFAIGGAGAIAAMAFGTETVPRVDAIVGPGNRWVTEAKRQLAGSIAIDSPAGPSEVLVIADESADAGLVAAEMLAQAEHDREAGCVALVPTTQLANAVEVALADALANTPRRDIARRARAVQGAILVVTSFDEAVAFTERYAPEHLSIMTSDAAELAGRFRNAGTIFVGAAASVAFGDYMTGANHVLPTAGGARSFSGLSAANFMRSFTVQEIDELGARAMAAGVGTLADAEGLPAHAAAARARLGVRP